MNSLSTISVKILSTATLIPAVKQQIQSMTWDTEQHPNIKWNEQQEFQLRSPDPTFVIAVISSGSILLGTLIPSFLQFLKDKKAKTITISKTGGYSIQIYENTDLDKVKAIIAMIEETGKKNGNDPKEIVVKID